MVRRTDFIDLTVTTRWEHSPSHPMQQAHAAFQLGHSQRLTQNQRSPRRGRGSVRARGNSTDQTSTTSTASQESRTSSGGSTALHTHCDMETGRGMWPGLLPRAERPQPRSQSCSHVTGADFLLIPFWALTLACCPSGRSHFTWITHTRALFFPN